MKVKCVATEGYLFSMKLVRGGNQLKTRYEGMEKEKTYTVYGMIMYENSIKYLLYDNYEMACWYPGELFEVIDTKLPSNWCYQFYGYQEFGVSAIWGYKELLSDRHYGGLINQDFDEIQLFLKRKGEIELEESSIT